MYYSQKRRKYVPYKKKRKYSLVAPQGALGFGKYKYPVKGYTKKDAPPANKTQTSTSLVKREVHTMERNTEMSKSYKFADWFFGDFLSAAYTPDTVNVDWFCARADSSQQCLNLIKYGNTPFSKVGNRVLMHKLEINCHWLINYTTGNSHTTDVRISLFYCRDIHVDAYPVSTFWYTSIYSNGTAASDPFMSNMNPELIGLVEILLDERFSFPPNGRRDEPALREGAVAPTAQEMAFQRTIDLEGRDCVMGMVDGAGPGQVQQVLRGALILVITGRENTLLPDYGICGSTRLWFCEEEK